MNHAPEQFWMVMRLSKASDEVQQVDSLPHRKHSTREAAIKEAERLAEQSPNARGFVVLEAVSLVAPVPKTITQSLRPFAAAIDFKDIIASWNIAKAETRNF